MAAVREPLSGNEAMINQPVASEPASPVAAPASVAAQPGSSAGMTTKVVRGSLWTLGGQGVTILTALVATPFVIRLLGTESYGVLSLINVLIGYLAFSDMGMGNASTRFGGEAFARNDEAGEAAIIWTSLAIAMVPAALIAGALALTAPLIVQYLLKLPVHLQAAALLALQITALGFVCRAGAGVMNTPQIVRLRMDWNTLVNSGCLVAQIITVPVVLFFGGGLIGAVSVITSITLASLLLHALIAYRLLPRLAHPQIRRDLIKPLSRFGAGLVVSSFAGMLLTHAEKFFIVRLASVSSLAYYSVAFNLAWALAAVPIAMASSTLPAFSRLQADPDREPLKRLYTRALRGNLLWVAPASLLLCVIARPFFTLWAGPDYGRESTPLFYILVAGLILNIIAYVPYMLLMAYGRSDIIARIHVSELGPYVAGMIALTYYWGALGAAIAWSLRVLADTLLFTLMARRLAGFSVSPFPGHKGSYGLALACLLAPIGLMLGGAALAIVAAATLLSLAAYGAIVWTRVLAREERDWLQAMLRSSRSGHSGS